MKDTKLKLSLIESAINILTNINIRNVEDVDFNLEIFSNDRTKLIIEVTFDEYINYLTTEARSLNLNKG